MMIGRHNRLRACLVTSLAIIVAALLSTVSASQECVQITDDYDLRSLARNDNVLLIVYDDKNSRVRKNICNKIATSEKKESPNGRKTEFAYLLVTDGPTRIFANTLNVDDHFPSFLFIPAGMDSTSKYSDHVSIFREDKYKQNIDALDTVTPKFSDFMNKHVGHSSLWNNDVFTIIFFDSVASRFVSYGNASGLNRLNQKGLALLVKVATLVGYKEPFRSIGKLYNRAFAMSLEHGMDYNRLHVARMEQTIQSGDLTSEENHQLQQKIAILKSFSQPKKLTAEDERKIFFHVALHIGLLVAALILIFLPGDSKYEEDEAVNAVPIIAKVVDEKN